MASDTASIDSEVVLLEKPKSDNKDALLCPNCLGEGRRNADGSRPKLWNGEKCRTCGYRTMSPTHWEPADHSLSGKKAWITRKMKYGPSGTSKTRRPCYKEGELFKL